MLTRKAITVAALTAAVTIAPLAALRPVAQAVSPPFVGGVKVRAVGADPAAVALIVKMYASYRALNSFSCTMVSTVRGRGWGTGPTASVTTAPVGETTFAVEKPYRVAITRRSIQDGTTRAVSDGVNLSVWKTGDDRVNPRRYLKLPLQKDGANIAFNLSDFGGLPDRGEDEYQMFVPQAILGYDMMPADRYDWKMGRPGEVDGEPVDTVTLRQGDADGKRYVALTLMIGRRDHLLRRVVSQYHDGNLPYAQGISTFKTLKINPKLPASLFVFTPPPGSQPVTGWNDLYASARP